MKGSDFIFDFANLLHSKCHRIRLKHGGSYIVSPDWIKNNKATIGPIGYDEKCFQYTTTATLSLFKIGLFSASHRWGRGQKICHTYTTLIKFGTVIPYLNEIQKTYKSCDTLLVFC